MNRVVLILASSLLSLVAAARQAPYQPSASLVLVAPPETGVCPHPLLFIAEGTRSQGQVPIYCPASPALEVPDSPPLEEGNTSP